MDWQNERYVRVFIRDTADLLAVGWQGRNVLWEMMRKCDRAGIIDGDTDTLPDMLRLPPEVVADGLTKLLARNVVVACRIGDSTGYLIRNFLDAQEAKQSDAQRQRESRARRRELARMGDVTICDSVTFRDANVTERNAGVTNPVTNVTAGHTLSQPVTRCHTSLAVPSRAEPSELSLPTPPTPGSGSPGARAGIATAVPGVGEEVGECRLEEQGGAGPDDGGQRRPVAEPCDSVQVCASCDAVEDGVGRDGLPEGWVAPGNGDAVFCPNCKSQENVTSAIRRRLPDIPARARDELVAWATDPERLAGLGITGEHVLQAVELVAARNVGAGRTVAEQVTHLKALAAKPASWWADRGEASMPAAPRVLDEEPAWQREPEYLERQKRRGRRMTIAEQAAQLGQEPSQQPAAGGEVLTGQERAAAAQAALAAVRAAPGHRPGGDPAPLGEVLAKSDVTDGDGDPCDDGNGQSARPSLEQAAAIARAAQASAAAARGEAAPMCDRCGKAHQTEDCEWWDAAKAEVMG